MPPYKISLWIKNSVVIQARVWPTFYYLKQPHEVISLDEIGTLDSRKHTRVD